MTRFLVAMVSVMAVASAASADGRKAVDRYEARSVTYTGGDYKDHVYNFRVLPPAKVEKGKKYPVVLYLHGAGERGNDNVKQLIHTADWISEPAQRSKYACWLIIPQCPNGKMWIDAHWGRKEHRMSPEPTHEARMALAALDAVMKAEASADADRVYLTGLSMGGYGSWDLACRTPERWAAVVPICGGGDVKAAEKLVGVPVWAWHGDKDGAVNVERSRGMIKAIKAAGGEPKYTELPGVGHNSWDAAYEGKDNVWDWMFSQRLSDRKKGGE